jgi:hypothetical protein
MANESVTGNLSFKILPQEIKKRFKGSMSYQALDSNEKWIYKKILVDYDGTTLMGDTDDFLTITSSLDDPAAASDNIRFVIIKHTGYATTDETTTSPYGVLISFDNTISAWNTTAAVGTPLLLAPGDTMAMKIPNTQLSEFKAITCLLSGGIPSGASLTGNSALVELAAIVDDGA